MLLLALGWLVVPAIPESPRSTELLAQATKPAVKVALGLYKGSEEPDPAATRLAQVIRPALEALGWKLELWDIEKGRPSAQLLGKSGALVTWFASPKMADSLGYVRWLAQQNAAGKKVVVFGNFGAHTSDGNTWLTNEQLNEFFYPFGLDYKAAYTAEGGLLKLLASDAIAPPPPVLTYYLLFRSSNPKNRVHLSVSRSDLAGSESALVVTTPHGGIAQETYLDTLDKKAFLAQALAAGSEKVATTKRILGLYKSSEGQTAENNHIVKFAEKPLFDLGYSIDFHDINSGLPTADRMAAYQAVLSWYQGPEMRGAAQYAEWLRQQIEAGRKVVILGNYGAFSENVPTAAGAVTRFLLINEYNQFYYPFGLEFRAAWTPDRSKIRVVQRDSAMIPWLPDEHVGHYFWIRSINPANRPFLTVDRADFDEGEAAVVVATPYGGLALESYILKEAPGKLDPDFHLDLKRFFEACLSGGPALSNQAEPQAIKRSARPVLPRLDDAHKPLPPGVTRIQRKVLAFYQKQFNELPDRNSVHQAAETVLNHLGLVVDYRAVEDPLPTDQEMEQYRGVVLWLTSGEMVGARSFDTWLRRQIANGKRLAILGQYAPNYESSDKGFVDPGPTFAALGLRYRSLGQKPTVSQRELSAFTAGRTGKRIKLADPQMVNFERPISFDDKDIQGWPIISSVAPENKVYVTLTAREIAIWW